MDKKLNSIVQEVHEIFKRRELRLSLAESCTGGLVSHYLTALPGASKFLEACVVAYSPAAKEKLLAVSSMTLLSFGAVSRETAEEMAEGIRTITETDYAISTTGNLGPEVLENKERGLVYIALSKEGKTVVNELKLKGGRKENKEEASLTALKMLIDEISRYEQSDE